MVQDRNATGSDQLMFMDRAGCDVLVLVIIEIRKIKYNKILILC